MADDPCARVAAGADALARDSKFRCDGPLPGAGVAVGGRFPYHARGEERTDDRPRAFVRDAAREQRGN